MFEKMICTSYGKDWLLFGRLVGPEITSDVVDLLIAQII